MADITKSADVSMDAASGMYASTVSGKLAGEAIAKGDALYIKASDGKLYKAIGAADNEANRCVGLAFAAAAAGEPVTAYGAPSIWEYSTGLTPGAEVFLSFETAGALADAGNLGHPLPLGHVVDAQRIRIAVDLSAW